MSMPLYKKLREMTDEELIDEHDRVARLTVDVTPQYCSDELFRREQRRQTKQMLTYTNWIKWFTFIVMISTIISMIAVLLALLPE